jgi:hypothetical protein
MVDLRSVGTHLGAAIVGILGGVGLTYYELIHKPRVNREREEKQIAYLDRMMDTKFQQMEARLKQYTGANPGATMTDGGYPQQMYQQDDSKYNALALRMDNMEKSVGEILDFVRKNGERQ